MNTATPESQADLVPEAELVVEDATNEAAIVVAKKIPWWSKRRNNSLTVGVIMVIVVVLVILAATGTLGGGGGSTMPLLITSSPTLSPSRMPSLSPSMMPSSGPRWAQLRKISITRVFPCLSPRMDRCSLLARMNMMEETAKTRGTRESINASAMTGNHVASRRSSADVPS